MKHITAVVLTKNSAATLQECLVSLDFCSEILVVDDYSSDKTEKIARDLGIKLVKRHSNKNFSEQRNFALQQVHTPWALFVDSDEVVADSLRKEIFDLKDNPSISGYLLKREDTFMGRTLHHGETSSVHLLRLVRPEKAHWVRPVHEICQVDGKVCLLEFPLRHQAHTGIVSFLEKLNYYTSIEAEYRKKNGKTFSWVELLVNPPAKFVQNYLLRNGFLDRFPGFVMAFMMSLHSLFVRIKLYEYKN